MQDVNSIQPSASLAMSLATRRGLMVLGAAGALGLAGDIFLRASPWGVNVAIWIGMLILVLLAARSRLHYALDQGAIWLLVPAFVLSAAFAWRDSRTLSAVNALSVIICLGLMPISSEKGKLWASHLWEYAQPLAYAALLAVTGMTLPLFTGFGITWHEAIPSSRRSFAGAALRGIALAIPVIVVFIGLFVSADPLYQRLFTNLDWEEALSSFVAVMLSGWAGGALMWHMLSREARPSGTQTEEKAMDLDIRVGSIEGMVVLAALNLLFLSFIIVQFRYFFGGAAVVETSTTLTYAEYARRGFFELVTAAALVLLLLLVADALVVRPTRRSEWYFRGAALLLVAFTSIIMISALQRMRIYQDTFGLTELRLYTTAFMLWIAVLLAWFCCTLLKDRAEWFAFGALISGVAAVVVLNALNPDAVIVRTNVGRASFDASYHAILSADAVPDIIRALPILSAESKGILSYCLEQQWGSQTLIDWRTWNASRAAAIDAASLHAAELKGWARPNSCRTSLEKALQ